jgi:hypothetical protein
VFELAHTIESVLNLAFGHGELSRSFGYLLFGLLTLFAHVGAGAHSGFFRRFGHRKQWQ